MNRDALADENKATLMIGPVLMAMSRDLGTGRNDIKNHRTVFGKTQSVTAKPRHRKGFNCVYDVIFYLKDGTSMTLPMCDFASASDITEHKDFRYTIFI